MVRASDRHAVDTGSIPWFSKGIFFPESAFSADSLSVFVHCCVQSHALTSVHMIEILWSMSVWWIMATQIYPARTISDKNNQLDDCGRPSAISMLLQHGYIHALYAVIIIIILSKVTINGYPNTGFVNPNMILERVLKATVYLDQALVWICKHATKFIMYYTASFYQRYFAISMLWW